MQFIWDNKKAQSNFQKHNVSFEEAQTVFEDSEALLIQDPDHDEERFILLGLSASLRVLIVCHCYRENESIIRLISARKANKTEINTYNRRK